MHSAHPQFGDGIIRAVAPSHRSTGITLSAAVLFIGAAFDIFSCGLMFVGLAFLPNERRPVPAASLLVFVAVFYLVAAAWAISSGVGLLKLKEWARISTLIIGALLAFFCLLSMVFMLIVPLPSDAAVSSGIYFATRVFLGFIFGIPAAIGIWWLFYFNRKDVKQKFQASPLGGASTSTQPTRPLSISIIGWYLIVSAICTIWILFLPIPIFFFSIFLTGQPARLTFSGLGVLQVVMGANLLKLKNWARIAAICYFVFFGVNGVASALIPGNAVRFAAATSQIQRTFGSPPSPIHIPLWAGLFFSLPLAIVLPWFLVTRKRAFVATANQNQSAPQ
jgi:hypothetical protein